MSILLHFVNNFVSGILMIVAGNIQLENMITILYYGTMAVGALLLFIENIRDFVKEYKEIKRLEKEKIEVEDEKKERRIDFSKLSNYKYIFYNYTFVVALILWILMFWVSESMIRI
jgi:hypothetical protein